MIAKQPDNTQMNGTWENYAKFKTNNSLSARYYAFVTACFKAGIKAVAGTGYFENALDIACGTGDNTLLVADHARAVTGIDLSHEQIKKAQSNPALNHIRFEEADFLSYLPDGKYGLITAAWFHNYIHNGTDQRKVAEKIATALTENGAVVFLFPSDSFTRTKTKDYFARLNWQQAWYEHQADLARGVFSFQGSPWDTMTCWQPLFLFETYHPYFELHFLDTKKLCVEMGFLDESYLNPTFEVMYGRKREGL